ncbi:MerR family transcriptional regulator [Curtobacterium aurantiacum]|uniref:MerR family transcriptional regulator n=1 Tax=Curtobacterium aurantiacum TaxID=3236919 RepID=A0ABS5VEJ1_9MICO|nr:MerR family transcriptional regulator [Curtobacterium flaccumfaciens]MBT1544422.1 MerR family transcriptional regulator [Curtobacterium flaccumfaciens pv. flaccumfaciens]MBT1587250.1 MerR family transcriptional regulator [Curtobacterium flaccumfaciens pv. flaccumfaciens]MBT1674932.1 MerR family transcriptional regulator [Curtobacterium flaccumfaciens pv. flaccumfaciens]MBT1680742.1 MerR family transcriptional regulator [Curtobacterium flaccumfaciens pv. flaccumfaciens]
MRIGELAEKTGVAPRMLRYYEKQGLIQPTRLPNGYRDYDDYLIERVGKIRGLVDSGIPTRIIIDVLPCLDKQQAIVVSNVEPGLRDMLVEERDRMAQKIDFLIQNRDALTAYIEALDAATSDRLATQPS